MTRATYATASKTAYGTLNTASTNWTSAIALQTIPITVLLVQNTTDVDLEVSFNATAGSTTGTVHCYVPTGGTLTIDYQGNERVEYGPVCIRRNAAMASGNAYVTAIL